MIFIVTVSGPQGNWTLGYVAAHSQQAALEKVFNGLVSSGVRRGTIAIGVTDHRTLSLGRMEVHVVPMQEMGGATFMALATLLESPKYDKPPPILA